MVSNKKVFPFVSASIALSILFYILCNLFFGDALTVTQFDQVESVADTVTDIFLIVGAGFAILLLPFYGIRFGRRSYQTADTGKSRMIALTGILLNSSVYIIIGGVIVWLNLHT